MIENRVEDDVYSPDQPPYWQDHVAINMGRHNIPKKTWDRICKIRSRPIQIKEDIVIGDPEGSHNVILKDSKGYLVDHPEAIKMSDEERLEIEQAPSGYLPAIIYGHKEILFLNEQQFMVVPHFPCRELANVAWDAMKEEMEKEDGFGKEG